MFAALGAILALFTVIWLIIILIDPNVGLFFLTKRTRGRGVWLCFVAVFLVGVLNNIEENSNERPYKAEHKNTNSAQQQKPNYQLTAKQIYSEYDANEVAADIKYKGAIVLVSGTVENIGKDLFDNAYIVLSGDNYFSGVHCSLPDTEKRTVAKLAKGQKVLVKGVVSGKTIGDVMLDKCVIQPAAQTKP